MLLAQGPGHGTQGEPPARLQTPWGMAGEPKAVRRTIRIAMTDSMRFIPDKVAVRHGDVVRFILVNEGKLLHDFVMGTKPVLDTLAEQVAKPPHEVFHARADRLLVEPGRSGESVWNFNRRGVFQFACLFPGHYQAGMVGSISVAEITANP